MTFWFCSCFKRNRASYDMSSENISYIMLNPITPTVTSPPLSSSFDPSIKSNVEHLMPALGNEQTSINNPYLTPTMSTKSNSVASTTPNPSVLVMFEDDSELYAKVDKTRIAKNSIRIEPDTSRTGSTSTIPSRPRSSLNLRINDFSKIPEHRPLSFPVHSNVAVNTTTSYRHDISSRTYSHYEYVEPHVSLLYRTQRSKTDIGQTRISFSITSERESSDDSDSYAELEETSTTNMIHPTHPSPVCPRSPNNSRTADDSSERYATISEVYNPEHQSTPNNLSETNKF